MKGKDRQKARGGCPLSDRQRLLCELVAHGLFDTPFQMPDGVDWLDLFRESNMQGVHLTAFRACHRYPLSQEQMAKIKSVLVKYMIRDAKVQTAHTELHRVLTEAGIDYTVIKGAASARYYPAPGLRSMGDVDFFVARQDIENASEVLRRNGYEVREMDNDHHVILDKGGVRFEMHYEPVGLPEGRDRDRALALFDTLTADSALVSNGITTCRCPSDFHHGLILLMHTQHHMLSEGIGLRHLCDWAVFVRRFEGDEFPRMFEDCLRSIGLWQFARLLSLTCARHLGIPRQSWMEGKEKDAAVADALLADIFAGGNFGIKDRQRRYEGVFISHHQNDGKKRNRFSEGIRYLNSLAVRRWPVMGRVPLLLPFAWILLLIGFAGRNRQRKKQGQQVSTVKAFQGSAARKQLYQKLHIYESDGENQR